MTEISFAEPLNPPSDRPGRLFEPGSRCKWFCGCSVVATCGILMVLVSNRLYQGGCRPLESSMINTLELPDRAWREASSVQEKLQALLKAMSGSEKCSLVRGMGYGIFATQQSRGYYVGGTPALERLGVPSLKLADAGQGFRTILPEHVGQVTSWPCALAVAATWDTNLAEKWGRALGAEFRAKGANMLLGPGVNVHRVPRNGRNAEYISGEEPLLGVRLAPAYIRGVQSQKVLAVVKHFILNNQETNRYTVSSHASPRTLWEVYYAPFEAAVAADVAAVMCAYNLVNGEPACGNDATLLRDLKGTMNFTGWVMADWWATKSFSASQGLDQEMPGAPCYPWAPYPLSTCHFSNAQLRSLSDSKLDDMVGRILRPVLTADVSLDDTCVPPDCTTLFNEVVTNPTHVQFARELAASGAVLLKNSNNVLPIQRSVTKLAILGSACDAKNDVEALLADWKLGNAYVLGGSGKVIPKDPVSIVNGVRNHTGARGIEISFDGSDDVQAVVAMVKNARDADLALVCGSATSWEEDDRPNLNLDQDSFINGVLQYLERVNVPAVVLALTPGSILMPWRDKASAIVAMFLSGQETGNAAADVLFGEVNPSGRLPVTFPVKETDMVAPCLDLHCAYKEGLFVGWRNLQDINVAFPFGHGLSYTKFTYKMHQVPYTSGCPSLVCISVEVQNDGKVTGSEVVQLYLAFPPVAREPSRVLRDFQRINPLAPGESIKLPLSLSRRDVQIFNETSMTWQNVDGPYHLYVASSSRDPNELNADFTMKNGVPEC